MSRPVMVLLSAAAGVMVAGMGLLTFGLYRVIQRDRQDAQASPNSVEDVGEHITAVITKRNGRKHYVDS